MFNQGIRPQDIGGYGRGIGRHGGIEDLSFATHCPPDVQPGTRIIAISGVADVDASASPQGDGWFYSDFYLFHHLLRNTATFQAASQLWFTCDKPSDLVEKYGQYVHGSATGDRRVVLDRDTLPILHADGNIRVCDVKDLRERFLSTLRDEINRAAEYKQPVLVLVFGHGDKATKGITIGSDRYPKLHMRDFAAILGGDVSLSLLVTSCYSGGWVMTPVMGLGPRAPLNPNTLNMTAMTAAGPGNQSLSWPLSDSVGRAGGSVVATAVLHALIATAESTPTYNSLCTSGEQRVTKTDDGTPIEEAPTYVNLACAIYDSLKALQPSMLQRHNIKFGAQDDEWEMEWRPRTGFPLTNYRQRWEMLKSVPPGATEGASQVGGEVTSSEKRFRVYSLCKEYMNSHPGADNLGGNILLHNQIRRILQGQQPNDSVLGSIQQAVRYRLDQLHIANWCARLIELEFEDAMNCDTWSWEDGLSASSQARLIDAQECISKSGVFRSPFPGEGRDYRKPVGYLALAMLNGGSFPDLAAAQTALENVRAAFERETQRLAGTDVARSIMRDPEVVKTRRDFWRPLRRVRKRMRSLSPMKASPRKSWRE